MCSTVHSEVSVNVHIRACNVICTSIGGIVTAVFHTHCFRFKLVGKLGQSITALACCIGRPNEILAGLADYSIKCIDVGELSNFLLSY